MLSPTDRQRARFQTGDTVSFRYRRRNMKGTVLLLNPVTAVVQTESGRFRIPYERLISESGMSDERIRHLECIQTTAEALMKQHGLNAWRFEFDRCTRRAGCCNYRKKLITLAFDLAANGTPEEVKDTILHEIAHALVGREHNHDAVWKAKAIEIGGSGRRTHQLQFSTPRWSVTCENRCWTYTAQQRNSKLICRKCGARLVYTPYTAP
ncbi:transcription elongation protein SprT [Verrucomicrobia bacterium S94]|nr:transcription elongation protein SprT [Verrucomicrobia bacterium S94]